MTKQAMGSLSKRMGVSSKSIGGKARPFMPVYSGTAIDNSDFCKS
jgi:hypothetical protein